jgi:uncharacterized membrane protein (DUF2068 family)
MAEEKQQPVKKKAPALYAIIAIKLLKGSLLLAIGLGVYHLIGQNLDARLDQFLRLIHLDPEKKFFSDLGDRLLLITPLNMKRLAVGTILYSMFSLIEGIGLIFRMPWAGWLAIGESGFFIPIEIYELSHRFSATVFVILLINIWIVWYLLQNRHRLFKHHH